MDIRYCKVCHRKLGRKNRSGLCYSHVKKHNKCKTCGLKIRGDNKSGFCIRHRPKVVPWNVMKPESNPMFGKKHSKESIEKMKANQWDRSGNKNPMFGKTHNKEARRNISNARKEMRGKLHHTEDTKRKMRISTIEYLKTTVGNYQPRYNKDACKFFEYINSIFNLKGQHAENGGEHFIKELGYWLDYIDFENKLIIENNERKHYDLGRRNEKTKLKEKELKRFYPDFVLITTRIPRAGKYEQERLNEVFEKESRRIAGARKVLS